MSARLSHLLPLLAFLIASADVAWSQPGGAAQVPNSSGPVPGADAKSDPLPPGAIARLGALRLQHGGTVSSLLFTRDGKGLVSAGSEAVIRLWDPGTGLEIQQFAGHEGPVYSVALSPDGKVLASGGEDQTIRLWDVATGRELKRWSVAEEARALVAFSPSGKVLASGGKGSTIVLWDVETGKELKQFKGRERNREGPWDQSEGGTLLSLAFTPDGRHLLTAMNVMTLWDLTTGKRVRNYEAFSHGGWSIGRDGISVSSSDVSKAISFSADGQTFVMPSHQHGAISLWELDSVEERGRLEGHENIVLTARFSPDGKTLASAGFDGTLRIWDANTLKELHKIDIGKDLVTELAVSPDGQTVALGATNGRIRLWDVKTGKERAAGTRTDPVLAIGFSADGRGIVSLEAWSLRQWDASTGKEVRKIDLVEEKKEQGIMRLSADRRVLVQARPGEPIRLLDATTGKEIRALEGKFDQVLHLSMSGDGKTVAAATAVNTPEGGGVWTIRVWDATTGKEIQQLPARPMPVTALAISPDARTVAAAEAIGGFRLWELATGKERRRLAVPARPRILNDEFMEMRLVQWRRVQQDEGQTERHCPVVFTPDGKGLAVGEGDTIRIWDLASGAIVRRFACDAAVNGEFAFSPDGRLVATGGPDHAIWIWNTASAEMLARLRGHRGPVHRLGFSSDSKALVSASADGTAVVWDVARAIAASRSQPRADPTEERLAALWADLADADAARAYGAIRKLVDAPKLAVRLVRERLQPAPAADPERIARLVADLDDSEFQVRDKASHELERLHELAAAALDKALAAEPPLEARRRLEALQQKVQRRQLPAETVRALRAVEVLEAIGTPEARQQLETLAKGVPEARLTKEAKAALERLTKQTGANAPSEKGEALGSSRP
jgi:WD40 repeat protein